ncbi:MAG: ParB/RepB/Spo0J family partition protein [Collinsella aerofaciens]
MQLKRVKTEDVYPSEGNPRRDFGDLDALAASFALNPAHPGEPMTPPLLVQDGGVYRIVDGERRWRAMRKAGTAEFDAVVCEDWGDADAALAMLATDDKKPLDDAERSRGAQRCLLLGVEPEKVERAVRKKGMARVRRVASEIGAEAETMSLDHLLAVAEFTGQRAVRVADASERDWPRVARECRREVESERIVAAFDEAAGRLGVELHGQKSFDTAGYAYDCRADSPEAFEDKAADDPEGAAWVLVLPTVAVPYAYRYVPADNEEKAARRGCAGRRPHGTACREAAGSVRAPRRAPAGGDYLSTPWPRPPRRSWATPTTGGRPTRASEAPTRRYTARARTAASLACGAASTTGSATRSRAAACGCRGRRPARRRVQARRRRGVAGGQAAAVEDGWHGSWPDAAGGRGQGMAGGRARPG